MKQGFVKVAAVTPKIKVADTAYNGKLICSYMEECAKEGAKIVVFPELCITGYTCQDLFLQDKLLQGAEEELLQIAECSASMDGIFFVGLPYEVNGKALQYGSCDFGRRSTWYGAKELSSKL